MGLEDRINKLLIRMVMGGKHLQNYESTDETPSPESMGSLKRFFVGWLEELKKDILKQKKEKSEE